MATTDCAHLATEQRNPRSLQLGSLSIPACVRLIIDEDAAIHDALLAGETSLTRFIEALAPRFQRGGRLIYLGAGTSGRLGVLDAAEMGPTFQLEPGRIIGLIAGGERALTNPSEGAEDDPNAAPLESLKLTADDTLLGITASGRTPFVIGALARARTLQPQVLTALLCCSPSNASGIDHIIHLPSGPEVLTGSTRMKAGTATKQALNIISTTLMVQGGRVVENLMVQLSASNDKLRDRKQRIQSALTDKPQSTEILYHLTIDGGATKTALRLYHADGRPAQDGVRGPGLNPYEAPLHQFVQTLRDLLKPFLPLLPQCSVTAAISGAGRPEFRELITATLTLAGAPARHLKVGNDAELLLARLGEPAILLVAGTGSICIGRAAGRRTYAGGLGRMLGDEGSGYSVGLAGLKASLQASHGWGAPTQLVDRARAFYKTTDLDHMVVELNAGRLGKSGVASFCREVTAAAQENDGVANRILGQAAFDLSHLLSFVARQLPDAPVYLYGGLFRSSAAPLIERTLRTCCSTAIHNIADQSPCLA